LIRAPVVFVGGHVDHGKTTLLDYLRGSTIAKKEAGKITQHIGATEISLDLIKEQAGELLKKYGFDLKIPGLLFIDTPGHEAFSTLRQRGASIANIGVLVIDILQGIQPQTIEVLNYLKKNKTPFVVALTKIDKIKGYNKNLSLTDLFKEIDEGKTIYAQEFNDKLYKIMSQLSEQGFNSERFDNNLDFTKKLLLIPLSSKDGKGIPELLLFLAGLSQKYLENSISLNVEGPGKAMVLEINDTKGFGKTADIILYDGKIKKNDFVKIDAKDNFYVTKIKQLLRPQVLTDLRTVKSGLVAVNEVGAAAGIKVVFQNAKVVAAGDNISVITEDEANKLETTKRIVSETKDKGIIVRADTQGSVDAILSLAKKQNVEIAKANTGNLTREDILEAKLFARENFIYSAVFVFNVKINPEIKMFAKQQGIKIFESNIIYKLFEEYEKWCKNLLEEKKSEDLKDIKYPCKMEILNNCIFRKNKPCILGVKILDGVLKPNTKIVYNGKQIGTIKQLQVNAKSVGEAKKEDELAVSFEGVNFEKDIDLNVTNIIYTFIPSSQRSIVKKYLSEEYPELVTELFDIYNKFSL